MTIRLRRAVALALTCLAACVALVLGEAAAVTAPAAAATPATVVSLTFDDSDADQMAAVSTMGSLGLHGTFYAITGSIGAANYLTLAQLQQIYAAGNEIGGHTVNHPDLTTEPTDEAQRQVCLARNTLTGWGFPQTDFAYPYATVNSSVETVVKNCGYNSARGLGDIRTRFGCSGCAYAEKMPPTDPYDLAAADEVDNTWTLTDLENTVLNAESHGGGWVILTFHHVCAGATCDPLSITPTLFASFASWLSTHVAATPTTSVKTVAQVIGGTVKPAVTPPAPPTISGAMTNSSLETLATDGTPSCWSGYQYGTNTASFSTLGTGAHTGTHAEQITMSGYSNGAAGFYPTFDTGGCTPSATPGHSYAMTAWYHSTVPVQFAVYYRDPAGGFVYWTSSPYFAATSGWAGAQWTTPALPAGASGISFGLSIFANGTLVVDDLALVDAANLPSTAMANASLETTDITGTPTCWTPDTWGTNTATYTTTSPGHTGSVAETVTMTQYTSGAAQLLPTMYSSTCAPVASGGHTYTVSAWFRSTAVTQFVAYYQAADGSWNYLSSGPWLAASSTWTNASWTTPALPAGATRIAFGLSLFSTGSLTTDDYTEVQAS